MVNQNLDDNQDTGAHNSLLYKQSLDHVFVYISSGVFFGGQGGKH